MWAVCSTVNVASGEVFRQARPSGKFSPFTDHNKFSVLFVAGNGKVLIRKFFSGIENAIACAFHLSIAPFPFALFASTRNTHAHTLRTQIVQSMQMAAIFPILDVTSCVATKWTRHMGFCITYTALLMKTWRYALSPLVSHNGIKLENCLKLIAIWPVIIINLLGMGWALVRWFTAYTQ